MRFHFWHTFMSLFFMALIALGLWWLSATDRLVAWVPLGDFVLMALATHRLTHLFVYDHITAFIREWFVGRDQYTFAGTLGSLINCQWCTGLWFAFVVVFMYFATPLTWYVLLILSLSSLSSIFQNLSNFLAYTTGQHGHRETGTCELPHVV